MGGEGHGQQLVDQLLKQGVRVQECMREYEDDNVGRWYGALVGSVDAATVTIGYDDGDLHFHPQRELKGLFEMGKFKSYQISRRSGCWRMRPRRSAPGPSAS